VSCPKKWALQISLAIGFNLFTENSHIESLFESLLPQPYEFLPLFFSLICSRMLQDTNIDFTSDLNLYYTAQVSALWFTIQDSNPWALQVRCRDLGLKFRIYGLGFNV